jgi:hypothetical protein
LAPPPTTVPVLDERISDANDSTGNQFEGASPTIANASQTRNAALNGGPMRANSRFGHNLRRDPVAGEVYSHLSVAVEVIACLLATGIRFYSQDGERWGARGRNGEAIENRKRASLNAVRLKTRWHRSGT